METSLETGATSGFPYGTNAIRMYPAWAMLEYASSRLILFWEMAITLPRIIVSADIAQKISVISAAMAGNAVANTRSRAANPAILAPEDMKAVTAVGAP